MVEVLGCILILILFFRREEKHELSLLGIFSSHNFINGSGAGTPTGKSKETFAPPIWTWTHAPLTQRGMGYWSIFSCKSAPTFLFVPQHLPTHPGVLFYFNTPSDTRKSHATSDRLIDTNRQVMQELMTLIDKPTLYQYGPGLMPL